MTTDNRKIKIPPLTARIIFCAVMYILLAMFVFGLFYFSNNYPKIYHSPAVENGKADFSVTDLPSRDVACNLSGEWEFYYNQWIVTDGLGQSDGVIKLPGLWSFRDFGNGALPKKGYASYRLTVENVQPDIDVIVYHHYGNFAYRVFINGQLNYRSGSISKDVNETVITGMVDERIPYRTDGSPLDIVIEVSSCDGGLNAAPWLAATATGNSYGTSLRSFNYIALGITSAAVAVSVLSYFFFRYKRDITVPAFMAALYAHFITSKDMLYVFRFRITASMLVGLFTAIAAFVLLIAHFKRSGAPINKLTAIITAVAAAIFTALLIAFYGTPLAPVFALLLTVTGCTYLVPIVFNDKLTTVQRGAYGALFVFMMSIFCFEMCDRLGLLVFGTEFIFTFELMLIIACFAVLWLLKLARTARTAIRGGELECELAAMKNKALKAQIKPHFVYNSLTAIQSRYRSGLKEGDRAIEQFARHLRLICDSDGEEMISFESEVRNVMNYFELENLRAEGRMSLLLDLSFTDFKVPVLSLQPLVENAVRHGGLREKQGGYVHLSSVADNEKITIAVADNGNGFDTENVHEGVGLENTRKRFGLIGATMQVISSPDRGTRIVITIPQYL